MFAFAGMTFGSVSKIELLFLALRHIVEDIDHVVVVFETLDESIDIFLLFGREFAHGERDTLEFEGFDFKPFILKELGDGPVVLEVGVDHDFVFIAEHFVDVVVDKLKLQFVHIGAFFVGDDEGAFALEEEVVHAHGAQLSLAAYKGGTNVGDGAGWVVGGSFDDEGGAVGAFAVVDDFFVGRLVFLGGTLDGALDILLGHALALGGGHEQTKTEVAGGVGTAGNDGQLNFFSNLGERAGHVTPTFQFTCFTVFKRSTHNV